MAVLMAFSQTRMVEISLLSTKTADLSFYTFCTKYLVFQISSTDTPSQTCQLLRSNAPCSSLSTTCTPQPSGVPQCLLLFRLCQWHHRWGSTPRAHPGSHTIAFWCLRFHCASRKFRQQLELKKPVLLSAICMVVLAHELYCQMSPLALCANKNPPCCSTGVLTEFIWAWVSH